MPILIRQVLQRQNNHKSRNPFLFATWLTKQLLELSQKGLLALKSEEMRAIQKYYREQGREPTDVELETLAQTWSEHCCAQKPSKLLLRITRWITTAMFFADETINGLLKHLPHAGNGTGSNEAMARLRPYSDNAGIVRFTDRRISPSKSKHIIIPRPSSHLAVQIPALAASFATCWASPLSPSPVQIFSVSVHLKRHRGIAIRYPFPTPHRQRCSQWRARLWQ